MDLAKLENELKKRWCLPLTWRYQNNSRLDSDANFIFSTSSFDKLVGKTDNLPENIRHYLINRWYNFWSDRALFQIFTRHQKVKVGVDELQTANHLSLLNIPFMIIPHVYPTQFARTFRYALLHKEELLYWLYRRPNKEPWNRGSNIIFTIFYQRNGEHWKLKAELLKLEKMIAEYLDHFEIQRLTHLHFLEKKTSYADLIWFVQEE